VIKIGLILHGGIGPIKQKGLWGAVGNENLQQHVDYGLCSAILKERLKGFSVDVFFHCWGKQFESDLVRIYNPVAYIVEEIDYFGMDVRPDVRDEGRWSTKSRFISLKKAHDLFKRATTDYDFVVVTRYDIVLFKDIDFEHLVPDVLYFISHPTMIPTALYDILFVGSPPQIDALSQVCGYFLDNHGLTEPHYILYHHTQLMRLKLEPIGRMFLDAAIFRDVFNPHAHDLIQLMRSCGLDDRFMKDRLLEYLQNHEIPIDDATKKMLLNDVYSEEITHV
jgi:hypothetical protein